MAQPTSTIEKPTTDTTTFNTTDRCDSCGAQAYAAATFAGGELLFCGHHFHRFQAELEKQALAIIDNTDAIKGK